MVHASTAKQGIQKLELQMANVWMLQKLVKHSKKMETTVAHVIQETAIMVEIVKQEIQVARVLTHNANVLHVGVEQQFKENVVIEDNDLCLFQLFLEIFHKLYING